MCPVNSAWSFGWSEAFIPCSSFTGHFASALVPFCQYITLVSMGRQLDALSFNMLWLFPCGMSLTFSHWQDFRSHVTCKESTAGILEAYHYKCWVDIDLYLRLVWEHISRLFAFSSSRTALCNWRAVFLFSNISRSCQFVPFWLKLCSFMHGAILKFRLSRKRRTSLSILFLQAQNSCFILYSGISSSSWFFPEFIAWTTPGPIHAKQPHSVLVLGG